MLAGFGILALAGVFTRSATHVDVNPGVSGFSESADQPFPKWLDALAIVAGVAVVSGALARRRNP